MAGRGVQFEDTCEITGVEHDVTVAGEILKFRERELIVAAIERSARVTLYWKEHLQLYVGALGGVEFQSPGPKSRSIQRR